MSKPEAEITAGDLRLMALSAIGQSVRLMLLSGDGEGTTRREPPSLIRLRTDEEEAAEVRALVARVLDDLPLARLRLAHANTLVQRVLDSVGVQEALDVFEEVRRYACLLTPQQAGSSPPDGIIVSSYKHEIVGDLLKLRSKDFEPDADLKKALDHEISEQQFVASVMQLCRTYRRESRRVFTPDDDFALQKAYRLVDEGVRLPRNYEWIRHTPARAVQTYLSFADPGEGHLAVTVREPGLLSGMIVHVEYIDRDNVPNKELVEAYRLPAVRNAARVRLHVGSETPVSAFIGRPVFEGGNYDLGLLKAGHTIASVCSAMFSYGIADCKVAMDGMDARQAVEFMRVVAGNVVRDPVRQRLSAAFNVNTLLMDNLSGRGAPRKLSGPENRFAIAELAVKLVKLGKFNKVAWDGASEGPSIPILPVQLTHTQLLRLVHLAHESGLETYISAGMEAQHMRDAVFTGVGGVGIGTKLHYVDKATGSIGEIDPAKVQQALEGSKRAAAEPLGLAARELAQLDWRYAEGSLVSEADLVRKQLFAQMYSLLQLMDDDKVMPPEDVQRLQELTEDARKITAEEKEGTGTRMRSGAALTAATADRKVLTAEEQEVVNWGLRVMNAKGLDDATARQIRKLLDAMDVAALLQFYPA